MFFIRKNGIKNIFHVIYYVFAYTCIYGPSRKCERKSKYIEYKAEKKT